MQDSSAADRSAEAAWNSLPQKSKGQVDPHISKPADLGEQTTPQSNAASARPQNPGSKPFAGRFFCIVWLSIPKPRNSRHAKQLTLLAVPLCLAKGNGQWPFAMPALHRCRGKAVHCTVRKQALGGYRLSESIRRHPVKSPESVRSAKRSPRPRLLVPRHRRPPLERWKACASCACCRLWLLKLPSATSCSRPSL